MLFNTVVIPFTGANLNGNEAHCYQPQASSVLAAYSGVARGCLVILCVNLCVLFFFFHREGEERNLGLSICCSDTNYANYYRI